MQRALQALQAAVVGSAHAGDRVVARLSENPQSAAVRASTTFPRKRAGDPAVVVSGGVRDPVGVELEQVVGCCD
jgi:hypothetical protein